MGEGHVMVQGVSLLGQRQRFAHLITRMFGCVARSVCVNT
jgi:hypothetical protein